MWASRVWATILPVSSIRPGYLKEGQALSREPGFVGIGDQLISFDPRYQNVFSNLLGRVADGGPAPVPALQVLNNGLAVLLPLHHEVLHGPAQGGLDGHGVPVGHL